MMYFDQTSLVVSVFVLFLILIILWRRNKSFSYLFFFSIFWVYLMGAISVAVFPFVILTDGSSSDILHNLNMIPFNFGNCFEYLPQNCIRDIYDNILLTIPFGFGIHFITRIQPKRIFWFMLAIGCFFEFTQFIMAFVFHISFRTIDINDAILNTTGAFVGYILFRFFGWLYLFITHKFQIQPRYIFAYIYDIVRHQN